MPLTFGRAVLGDPDVVEVDGPTVRLQGDIDPSNGSAAADIAEFFARREQLRGTVNNPDVKVWNLSWTEDPSFDGFYAVSSAGATQGPSAMWTGFGQYSLELVRPVGLVAPMVEAVTNSAVMVNDHAVVASATVASTWAVPGDALSVHPPARVAGSPASGSRVTPDGALKLYRVNAQSDSAVWTVSPSDFWDSAAQIEAALSGNPFAGAAYYPIPGRSFGMTATNWRLSNGMVRVTPSTTANKLFDVSFFNGSSWSAVQPVDVVITNPSTPAYTYNGTYDTLLSATVIRNAPECTVIRLTVKCSSTGGSSADSAATLLWSHATIDLTVRRGEPIVRLAVSPKNLSGFLTLNVGTAGGTFTALTGGTRSDNVVNSGRLLVCSPNTNSGTVTTNPSIKLSAARAVGLFGIGYEIAGASATTYNTAQQIIYQYLMSLNEKQKVVLR